VSLAIWDHTVLPATRHKRTHPALTPASEGWYSIPRFLFTVIKTAETDARMF